MMITETTNTLQHVRDFASNLGLTYPDTITNAALFDLVLQQGIKDESGKNDLAMDEIGIVYSLAKQTPVAIFADAE